MPKKKVGHRVLKSRAPVCDRLIRNRGHEIVFAEVALQSIRARKELFFGVFIETVGTADPASVNPVLFARDVDKAIEIARNEIFDDDLPEEARVIVLAFEFDVMVDFRSISGSNCILVYEFFRFAPPDDESSASK